ncbi:MAG: PEPxxWA-CTERM sorting domain-containing protein [Pseudomonadota bacterium]
MKKTILGIAAALCAISSPANAATNLVREGGSGPDIVWEDNGNRFGLIGADARPDTIDGGLVDLDYINSLITAGPVALNLFACVGGFDLVASSCDTPVTSSVFVNDGERLFDSLIVEFNGTGNVTWQNPTGGTGTLNLSTVTQSGPPPIGGAIPEPATWLMLILGFFGVGAAMRSKGAAGAGRREAFA